SRRRRTAARGAPSRPRAARSPQPAPRARGPRPPPTDRPPTPPGAAPRSASRSGAGAARPATRSRRRPGRSPPPVASPPTRTARGSRPPARSGPRPGASSGSRRRSGWRSRAAAAPRLHPPMTSDEIRKRFLEFFESRDHKRLPSASLVPTAYDPSTLLISAGMHPLKPDFLGQDKAPHHRLTTCQKCFRTVDIDNVGSTFRHLTFFEMLGNFSIGDYFKKGAAEFAWELSTQGFGFEPDQIWATVFEGDDELGLGPDEE